MKNKFIILAIFLSIFLITSFFVCQNSTLSENELLIISFIQTLLKDVPIEVAKFITFFGHERYWEFAIVTATIILISFKKYKDIILYAITILSTEYIYGIIKGIIQRPRPPIEFRFLEVGYYSFPSGHSTLSMVTYGLLIYFVWKYVKNKLTKITLTTALGLLIILIGISRIWLGVHFPTDVIGGFSLGLCIICIVSIINEIKLKNKINQQE